MKATPRCLRQFSASSSSPGAAVLNRRSRTITAPPSQGASQAMLHAAGLSRTDLSKAQVGIASVWWEGNPCNMHLLSLSEHVKGGVERAGLVGLRFNTIGVSDGISMGTTGMRYSLPSREVISDSVETVLRAQWYDGAILIPGCDKNMPGVVMGAAKAEVPAIMVFGGTIRAGCTRGGGKRVDIVSAFQAYGEFIAGRITEEERGDIVATSCPGPGACGGMYTANTMATAIEAMGMSLPYSSSTPADSPMKIQECLDAGAAMKNLLAANIRPKDIMTKEAFENAMVITMVLGGSTNAVLHLLAMAHTVGVPLSLDDFQRVADRTPFLANLKPSGEYVMEDMAGIGGIPAVIKYLLAKGRLHGGTMTVAGKTLGESVAGLPGVTGWGPMGPVNYIPMAAAGSKGAVTGTNNSGGGGGGGGGPAPTASHLLLRPLEDPIKPTGHITILYGDVAPEGSVAKITGKEGEAFEGEAAVFDGEGAFLAAMERGEIHAKLGVSMAAGATLPPPTTTATTKTLVCVIRYEGPQGGPGMPEMLTPTSAIMGAGLGHVCALITDGRFSGGSHGFIVGHISPEAALGGPLALLKDGDRVRIDGVARTISAPGVSQGEWGARRAAWTPPPPKVTTGVLRKFTRLVSSASKGCITDA